MWKARRWAVLGPMLGRRGSPWMSCSSEGGSWSNRLTASSPTPPRSRPRSDQPGRQAEAGGNLLHPVGGQLAGALQGLVDGSHHEVLQHLQVACDLRIHRDREDPLLAVRDGLDRPAAGGGFELLVLELGLHLGHPALHLLHLLHHLHRVLHHSSSFKGRTRTTLPSSFLSAALISGSSSVASGLGAGVATAVVDAGSCRRSSRLAESPSQAFTCGTT